MRLARLMLGAGLCLALGLANAGTDPAEWLKRMSEAARNTNYQGVVIYRSGDMMETMRLVHRYKDGEVRERIFSMTGEPREILRKDDEVTCIIPREKKITIDRVGGQSLFPELPEGRIEELKAHYEFQDLGTTRVAGRQCQGIRIQPKDEFRYGYQIWLDEQTAVPVKMTLVDMHGRMLEQVLFTQVDFPAEISDQALLPELDHKDYKLFTHDLTPMERGGKSRWDLSAVPPGFKLTGRDLRELPGGDGSIEHLMLSDGLSSVSIYSTSMSPMGKASEGMGGMGALHSFGRMIGDFHITVLGEVPARTVEMIGEGIRPADAQP